MLVRFDVEEIIQRILRRSALPIIASAALACGQPTSSGGADAGDAGEPCNYSCCGFVPTVRFVHLDGGQFPADHAPGAFVTPLPDGGLPDGGAPNRWCPQCGGAEWCTDAVMASGEPVYECRSICSGRLEEGVVLCTPSPHDALSYLRRMSEGEARSVASFRHLAQDLREHGAPPALIRRARSSARDEVRHTRIVRRLLGAAHHPAPSNVRRRPSRPLARVLTENAVEGCVHEAFGALMGAHQARAATNRSFRRAMVSIARDEAHHAQLAFDIHRELSPRLNGDERALVDAAFRAALDELRYSTAQTRQFDALGVPDRATAEQLGEDFIDAVSKIAVSSRTPVC